MVYTLIHRHSSIQAHRLKLDLAFVCLDSVMLVFHLSGPGRYSLLHIPVQFIKLFFVCIKLILTIGSDIFVAIIAI